MTYDYAPRIARRAALRRRRAIASLCVLLCLPAVSWQAAPLAAPAAVAAVAIASR